MNRLNQFLLLLVALQILLIWLVQPSSSKQTDVARLVSEGEFVTFLEIDDGENSVRLEKEGDHWVLPQVGGVRAKTEQADSLIQALKGAKLGRAVVKNRASHRRLKLADDEYQRRVFINNKDVGFLLGTSPSPQVVHVRLTDKDEVYQVENLNVWSFGVSRRQWVEARIIDKRKPNIQKFSLLTSQNDFHFSKTDQGDFQFDDPEGAPENQEFDESAFSIWLNQQGSWFLNDVVDREEKPEYGLDRPMMVLDFILTEDKPDEEKSSQTGESFTLKIGKKHPDKEEYYACVSGRDRIVTVPANRVQELLKRTRESFYKEVEKEEPKE